MASAICAPAPFAVTLNRFACPTCGRRVYGVESRYEWYGPFLTCLRCGEQYHEDGRADRPFARGWRERNKRNARKHYRAFHRQARP